MKHHTVADADIVQAFTEKMNAEHAESIPEMIANELINSGRAAESSGPTIAIWSNAALIYRPT